ncbi:rhodanese-like domain-containing protein [Xylocopilactobacillus apis]|uniref:Sulfurtransferase n=1 Tax=Xylocopilactobacillus apis TaxID=2932183 RepID=A0AAU9CQV9_9LACO|nr:rhodanese-like domain-containing protein [Xylocopilactobacillus apis]BDR56317.1 sulfurtransferase [Xylocopilactobacillus apis]
MPSWLLVIDAVLIAILLWIFGNWFYYYVKGMIVKGGLTPQEFEKKIHTGQIIDLRSKGDFDTAHIMGARNIPYAMFKQYQSSLRKDLPVLLYERSDQIPIRVAAKLKKQDYKEVYWLKGGFAKWEGNVKKKSKTL